MKFGFNSGATYSKFREMNLPELEYKYGFGFMAGISMEYYLNKRLSLKTNLGYDKKNSIGEVSNISLTDNEGNQISGYNIKVNYIYNYLTLPIFIKYYFNDESRYFVNGGIFAGYLIDSKTKIVSKLYNNDIDETFSSTDINNDFDFGLSIGFGKSIKISDKNSITIEIRDNLGLARTNKYNTFSDDSVKSNTVYLILGYDFDL